MNGPQLAYINHHILTWAREQRSLTPREAAGAAGVKPATWNTWESGTVLPTMEQAREIAHALRFPMGYLWLPKRPDEYPPSQADLDDRRAEDAIRRTLEEHATCIEDAGETPLSAWECDALVLARALEAARTAPGGRGREDGSDDSDN